MKKIVYTFLLFAAILTCSTSLPAQTVVDLVQNDSLIIDLDGYKQGDIQWQRSANGTTWSRIIAANNSETLRYKITAPAYFRSRVADGTCDAIISDTIQANMLQTFTVNAGHGYTESEPYVTSTGITMNEKGTLSNWNDSSKKAVWFLYQKPGIYTVSFNLRGTSQKAYEFEMKTTPAYAGINYEPTDFQFSYTGKGTTETAEFFTVTIAETGYYRYELNANSSMTGLNINTLLFDISRTPGPIADAPDTHATTYLSSPSVHLNFKPANSSNKSYEWMYEEILVPQGYDPLFTYYMSIGFFRGYMGIQTNSATERRVLFSVWDIVDKDIWPDAPKEALVSLVDKAPYTQANAFGGEGTGGQSYVGAGNINTWKTGTPVKFLMNCRRVQGIIADKTITGVVNKGDSIRHTIISAWYDAGEGWRYIASWRTPVKPNSTNVFDGFHSFLENYGWKNGQMPRKAYYYNNYGKTFDGSWIHMNQASYSNTDGSVGQRIDFEQGVAPEDPTKFYMLSGGYGKTVKTATNTVPRVDIENFPYLRDLDLGQFEQRVTEALEYEYLINHLEYKDKTDWAVTSFSSDEPNENGGTNGAARLIIDGNDDTYWHSKWTGGGSSFPHWFVIDMKEAQTIKGFRFIPSGGTNRYPKNISIKVSNDPDPNSSSWNEIWTGVMPRTPELLILNEAKSGYRYFKLTIEDGYADGAHTRLNEIYVF